MPSPLRLLICIDELDIGGTEQQILELVKRLDRRKYLPMVCCFRPGRVAQEIAAAGVQVFTLTKRAKIDPLLILSLWRLLRRERIEVLQTYLFTANTWARMAAILAGVPLILTSERNVDMWEEGYKRVLGRWLDRWTGGTIANSHAVKEYLVQKGLAPEKVRVIYNGVDPARFTAADAPSQIKAELGIPSHHVLVSFLARLEPQKDPSTFLQAAALLAQTVPHVSFVIIGGGQLQSSLEQEAHTLGLAKQVVFTGPRRDVPRLLAACDVSVLSSRKEGMSNTIMESMAAGKPMVATRVGGNPELIHEGETGFLVPTGDPSALATAMRKIVDDPERAKTMGRQARARVMQLFSVDAMVQTTEQLYDELIRANGRFASPHAEYTTVPEQREPGPFDPLSPRGRELERGGGCNQTVGMESNDTLSLTLSPQGRGEKTGSDEQQPTLAFLVSQFPRYVDAYFLREVTALAARGLRFEIFSLRGFGGKVIHTDAQALLPRTAYIPFFWSWPLWRAQAHFLWCRPGRYLGALWAIMRGCWRHPMALLKTLLVFPKSVYFAALVQKRQIVHVHANWASHPAAAAWVIARLTDVPWSFAGHASDIYLDTTMLAEKIRAAKFVVTCTRYNKAYLTTLAGDGTGDKVIASYHGVDLQKFTPVAKLPNARFRLLAVGTLLPCKGLPDLIEACRLLAHRGVLFACTIAGDGPERRALERQIRQQRLTDQVTITGYLAQEALIPLYQQADVVVLPALAESHFGIPNVLLEAMAVQTPVVCTPLPSLAEVIEDGKNGVYVPERAPEALADALEMLAHNPALRRAMGEAGRRKIQELFDTEKNVIMLDGLFRSPRTEREILRPAALE